MDELLTLKVLHQTSLPVGSNFVPYSSLACGVLITAASLPAAGPWGVSVVRRLHK